MVSVTSPLLRRRHLTRLARKLPKNNILECLVLRCGRRLILLQAIIEL